MFFKRFMALVLTMAMLCSGIVLAEETKGLLISPNPTAEQTQPVLTQAEINKNATGFTDIKPDASYAAAVKKLVDFGIIAGYPDGTFKPDGEITRAEMSKMINLTLGYTDFEGAAGFPDVTEKNWYYVYALAAQKQGYVEGYEDKTFRGSNNITRQEMCAILNRLLKPMNLGIPVTITDKVSNWARPHVELIVQNYIMPLEANNTFRATQNLKRHELATVLSNMAIGPVKPIEADVRFFVNGEPYGETQTVALGTCSSVPENPAAPDDSYEFYGWRIIGTDNFVNVATEFVNNDVDYEAVFVKKTYTVTFNSRGSEFASITVEHGCAAEVPDVPSVKGYSFRGWSLSENGAAVKLSETKIYEDKILYALFDKDTENAGAGGGGGGGGGGGAGDISYTVNFIVNGDVYNTQKIIKNYSPKSPEKPEREGYIFLGWSLSKEGELVSPTAIKVTSNVTLYAVFEKEPEPEPEVFAVVFYVDGVKYNTQYIESGKSPENVPNPSKDGYVFKHWSRSENGSDVEPSYVSITSNTNFYAVFEKEKEEVKYFEVKFMVDGEEYSTSKVQQGNKASAPASPKKDGYDFKGWSTRDGGTVASVSVVVESDLIFYAVFEKIQPKKYVVSFVVDGVSKDQQVVENETAVVPENPKKDGYVFKGWSNTVDGEIVNVGSIQITNSRLFYAVFEKKEEEKKYYTVTFISDGKTYDSQVVLENDKVVVPDAPQKADHEFIGWSKSINGSIVSVETTAKSDATYYAVFKAIKKFTVTFYIDDVVYRQYTVVENNTSSVPTAPSVDGYNFLGWSATIGGDKIEASSIKITKDTSFYAILEKKEPEKVFFNVTFKSDNKNFETVPVEKGKTVSAPSTNPEKEGYTFKGWSKTNGGNTVNVSSVMINSDTTFFAVFEKNPVYYEVVFVVDGKETSSQNVLEGKYPKVPAAPKKNGYNFIGWANSEDGTTVYPEKTPVLGDTKYYAIFEKKEAESYTVAFMFDGETVAEYVVTEGSTVDEPSDLPELDKGETFFGWSYDRDNDAESVIDDVSSVKITENTIFYSVIIKNPNSDDLMEMLARGRTQLHNMTKRASVYRKKALNTVVECIDIVIDEANKGAIIDKNYINRNHREYVDALDRILYTDMSEDERSQFYNQLESTIDDDVQEFLLDYFDVDIKKA